MSGVFIIASSNQRFYIDTIKMKKINNVKQQQQQKLVGQPSILTVY